MELGKNTSPNNETPDAFRARQSLLGILAQELKKLDDIYKNLLPQYDKIVYENFEKRFIQTRNTFKGMLVNISDLHYAYVNRSEKRKEYINQIIKYSTEVAERFQESRENDRFDRPKCTDSLENLIYAFKNLKHLIETTG